MAFNFGVPTDLVKRIGPDSKVFTVLGMEDDSIMADSAQFKIQNFLKNKFDDLNLADFSIFVNTEPTEKKLTLQEEIKE
jgi:hypothetical protein